MKLFFTAVIAFAAGILLFSLFQACNVKPDLAEACPKNVCTNYSNAGPFDYLNAELLYTMSGKYRNTSGVVNNATGINLPDARSIWFSLDSLKRFIWEIETNACRSNCPTDSLKLGVRIYYARYPITGSQALFDDISHLPNEYHERHTVFMVPTYDSSGTTDCHIDFDPRYFNETGCRPLPLKSIMPDSASRASSSIIALAGTTGFNHGGMCPPVCCADAATYFDR